MFNEKQDLGQKTIALKIFTDFQNRLIHPTMIFEILRSLEGFEKVSRKQIMRGIGLLHKKGIITLQSGGGGNHYVWTDVGQGLSYEAAVALLSIEKAEVPISARNVFIVHGHDVQPVKQLKEMLAEFGLNPIVLHEQPSGSRTIIEKLERYSDVGYAFVILTPDDVGCQGLGLIGVLNPRARQNVVLEFGYFIGRLGRDRVCCLYKGDVELPSDMQGIVYVPFKESLQECRNKIAKELRNAGYKIS